MVASEDDLGDVIADSLASVQQLWVVVQDIEFARVIHKFFVPEARRKSEGEEGEVRGERGR